MTQDYSYIAIEGNIGAGKTSLVELLSKKLGTDSLFETFENNPFLDEFYKDPERNAFPVEMFFLAERYRQLHGRATGPLVADYFIAKSLIFAGFTLQSHEMDLFARFYQMVEKQVRKPDLVIYIRRDTDYLLKSIQKRGRSYEKLIPGAYLEKVSKAYEEFFRVEKPFPVVLINAGTIDFYSPGALQVLIDAVFTRKWGNGTHELDL